jgi:hypothetical protein
MVVSGRYDLKEIVCEEEEDSSGARMAKCSNIFKLLLFTPSGPYEYKFGYLYSTFTFSGTSMCTSALFAARVDAAAGELATLQHEEPVLEGSNPAANLRNEPSMVSDFPANKTKQNKVK